MGASWLCTTGDRHATHVLASEPGHGGTRHANPADGSAQALAWGRRGGDEGPALRVVVSRSFRERAFRYPEARTRAPHRAAPTRAPAPHRAPPCPSARRHLRKGVSPLFQRVNSMHAPHAAPPCFDFYTGERLAMCGTASGGGGWPCVDVKGRPSGSRSRARASRAVLLCCSCESPGFRVPPCPGTFVYRQFVAPAVGRVR